MHCTVRSMFVVMLVSSSCGKRDEADQTDRATHQLHDVHAEISEHSKAAADNQDAIERTQRELVHQQQELADKRKLLGQQQQQLGSDAVALQAARVAYAAAVTERLAKLDASLATLSTKTDAKSIDAVIGLRARRDQLASKLAKMTATLDSGWDTYAKDVDVTFAAIERDLHAALN